MLGLTRYKVLLSPHNEDWSNQFDITKIELTTILGNNIINIYHVGSTAIKDIVAKPILDIAVVIKNAQSLNISGMEAAGYDYCGDSGIAGRHFFVKRQDGDISTHHIHCYLEDNENLQSTILFCKYLKKHPEFAKQYNDLKLKLASKYPDDRIAYTDNKSEFINMVVGLSKREIQK